MYNKTMGSYDEIPEGMKHYINNYGCHFNKKLYEEAVSRMFKEDEEGNEEEINPYSKEQIDRFLESHNIKLKRGKMYDACYVASMCKADYFGKSVPDERHMAMFIRDMIDDPDAVDGFIFNRFIADQMFMNNPIEWEDVI